ncbi:MAG: DUF1523 family protein, partial [Planktomarina sp.]
MSWIKWIFAILVVLLFGAFLHYTLPQFDVVWVTDTYEKRVDFGENSIFWAAPDSGNAAGSNRDVFFIQTFQPNGRTMIYRNEDTSWGWPPYLKFDTANLQAEAADLISPKDNPQWVAIRHYGWRNEFYSIYPNAVSVRAVDGPDVRIIPWMSIVILVIILAFIWAIFVRIRRFWRK